MAGGGVPVRPRQRHQVPRLDRWHTLADGLRGRRFGVGEGAATASLLVKAKYQASTKRNYINAWERFVAFCDRTCARALPASPETVVCYMASLFETGTCQPDTIYSYLAAIRAVHRLAGLPPPTDDELVADAKVGCRRLHVQAEGALPEVRGPLPPEAVVQFAALGLSTADDSLVRQCAGLVLAYLLFNRPGAAANMRAQDLRLTPSGLEAQVPVYKMGVLKRGSRLAFTIPLAEGGWLADAPLRLVRHVLLAHYRAGRPAAAHLFAPPGARSLQPLPSQAVTRWLERALPLTTCTPPLGVKWTGHSPRAGAASSAFAVGLSPALIRQRMGLASVDTAYKHYIDAQWRSTPAARALFSRYIPVRV